MQVTLAQQEVVAAAHFDFGPLVGIEQDTVANLDGTNMGPDRGNPGPRQPFAHGSGSRDHDSARRPAIACLFVEGDQESVLKHTNGEFVTPVSYTHLRAHE